jgi:molybdopterin synthase catalytic subunit
MMRITSSVIRPDELRADLSNPAAGAYAAFEGWIRNENEGRTVFRLEYESYEPLAVKEGERVIREARAKYPVLHAQCVHRTGMLEIGECAVWVGVTAPHRDEAFAACRYIIDQVKVRLPIWKKEHYADGHSGWVNCERCASHGDAQAARSG